MKLRSGFVSNSSSASYIVKFNMNLGDFLEEVFGAFEFEYFSIQEHIYFLKQEIKKFEQAKKKIIDSGDEKKKKLLSVLYSKDKLDLMKSKLKFLESVGTLDSYTDQECKFVPERNDVMKWMLSNLFGVRVHEEFEKVILNSWTAMHNSISDLPDIIKDILVHFDFSRPHMEKICEVRDESM